MNTGTGRIAEQKYTATLVVLLFLALFLFLNRWGVSGPPADLRDAPRDTYLKTAEPNGPVPAVSQKEWTVMVFMNAKNNLAEMALKDISEMEQVGSDEKVNIVLEVGRTDGFYTGGSWATARRHLIKKDASREFTSPVVQEITHIDMGDHQSIIDFGRWAKANYPARHYMLVIWSHGIGWEKVPLSKAAKGISFDEETGHRVDTPQMREILKGIGGADIYASDACLMQMAEVAYEIKDQVSFIVGSEDTEPGHGYAYDAFLGLLAANPGMSAENLAKAMVDTHAEYYAALNQDSTSSYLRTAAIPEFLKLTDNFTEAMIKSGEGQAAKKAVAEALHYTHHPDNKDLYHFVQLATAGARDPQVRSAGTRLMAYISGALVGKNRTTMRFTPYLGKIDSNSHGIAIYLPLSAPGYGYDELRWEKDSRWVKFINWYQSQ
ncbi:MAG: clostripain-related cysteine peptidase [Elusimicrobia bacterium]|nr:clostripain-related cysteine peptidase [Elusimicrobiota bacterium]